MGNFLRDNWIWIAAPIVLLIVLIVAILFFGNTGDDSPFVYGIF